jgi:hypothetical protein
MRQSFSVVSIYVVVNTPKIEYEENISFGFIRRSSQDVIVGQDNTDW